MDASSKYRVLVAVVATVMVLSALAVLFDNPSGNNGSTATGAHGTVAESSQTIQSADIQKVTDVSILSAMAQDHIPTKYVYIPNFNAVGSDPSVVASAYDRSPAPIGVSDFGYSTNAGTIARYSYSTSGFLGSFMSEGFNPHYIQNNAPESVAIQLNTVLNDVTIQGVSGYVFWVQNVMLFTPSEGKMQFISNIWSLSSPSMVFPSGAILTGNGEVVPGLFYYYAGPVISVPDTFTAIAYVDASNVNLNNAVTFQYEITGTESSSTVPKTSFDHVVFNSTIPGATIPAPEAQFMVSGTQKTPSGMLYDAELVMTGPGGGSTSSIFAANGQFKLQYKNPTGTYTNPAATFNYGSNTGETIEGLSSWWTGQSSPVDHLSTGPSILVPLWGSDVSRSGATNMQGVIDPPNAFIFMNAGTSYDQNYAAWGPISPNGSYVFALPGGVDYSGAIMMSDFTKYLFDPSTFAEEETNESEEGGPPSNQTGGGGGGENETAAFFNVTLSVDKNAGIYTPLYANGNDQVKYLTIGNSNIPAGTSAKNITPGMIAGTGVPTDPYMVENNQYSQLDPVFGQANQNMFPLYSGIMLMNTDVSVEVNNPASFAVKYPAYMAEMLGDQKLPAQNSLNLMFENTTGVTLWGAAAQSGWFANSMAGYPAASVMFWNSYDFLVGSSHFSSMGHSLLIYNDNGASANGVIWGNYFERDPITSSSYSPAILGGSEPTGLLVASSGNLIYNNYFDLVESANSPSVDPFTGSAASYNNNWNLESKQTLTYVNTVNNHDLSGAIVAVNYQGGNYWYHFDGTIPYNDNARIALGGDFYPLILPKYDVVFQNSGLPSGMTWSVTLDKETQSSTGSSIMFQAVNGTHSYSVKKPGNYYASPSTGVALVSGENIFKTITFTIVEYNLTFTQTGHPAGESWSVNLSGDIKVSTGSSISFMRDNGTYSYSVSGHQYYLASPSSGKVLVNGGTVVENILFTYSHHSITFTETGLPTGSSWSITISGETQTSSNGDIVFMKKNGTYAYTIGSPDGYVVSADAGMALVYGTDVTVNLEFTVRTYTVTFSSVGLLSGSDWTVIFDGTAVNSTSPTMSFEVPAGNYSYELPPIAGYSIPVNQSYVVVNGNNANVDVQFNLIPNHARTAGLMTAGAAVGVAAGVAVAYVFWRKP